MSPTPRFFRSGLSTTSTMNALSNFRSFNRSSACFVNSTSVITHPMELYIQLFYKALMRNVPKPFLRLLHTKMPSKPSLPIAVKENRPGGIWLLPGCIVHHQGLALPGEVIFVLHTSHQGSYSIFPSFTAFITGTFVFFIASNSSGAYTRISRATFGINVE